MDAELRLRVERILSQDFDVEDLNRIFLGLRERFFSREAFLEIGNFTAHADERTRGLATQRARDTYDHLRFIVPITTDVNLVEMSAEEVRHGLRATLRLTPDAQINNKRAQAQTLLGRLNNKIGSMSGTGWVMTGSVNTEEFGLLRLLTSQIISEPAFTGPQLFDEFCYVLIRNGLLLEAEQEQMAHAHHAIKVYGAWRMHNCQISMRANDVAHLRAMDTSEGLDVYATSSVPMTDRTIQISCPLYCTELRASDCCEDDIRGQKWDFPLRLTKDWKLARL